MAQGYRGPYALLTLEECQKLKMLLPMTPEYDEIRAKLDSVIMANPLHRTPTK